MGKELRGGNSARLTPFTLDFRLLCHCMWVQFSHCAVSKRSAPYDPLFFLSWQAFADLVITVLDENDSPPLFKKSSYEASIEENSEAGKTVVPVSTKYTSDTTTEPLSTLQTII